MKKWKSYPKYQTQWLILGVINVYESHYNPVIFLPESADNGTRIQSIITV